MLKEIVVIWEREGILHTIKAVIHVWISFDDDPTPYDKLLYVEMEAKKIFCRTQCIYFKFELLCAEWSWWF